MRSFQSLLNTLYERAIRECFEGSVNTLITTLEDVLAFMCESISGETDSAGLLLEGIQDLEEDKLLHLMKDPVLNKRIERNAF